MKAVVFQLHGPLASWGKQPAGTVRHVDNFPGRSNLLGLLGAALGIDRRDDAGIVKLGNAIRFAIKVWDTGAFMTDFQTCATTKPGQYDRYNSRKEFLSRTKNHTMITHRDYRAGGYWQVAAIIDDDSDVSAESIQAALLEPHYPLCLGRKACVPALPLAPEIVEAAEGVKGVFDQSKPRLPIGMDDCLPVDQPVQLYWEGEGRDVDPETSISSFDGVKSFRKRLFRSNAFNMTTVGE